MDAPAPASILTDFLAALGVPHTRRYSDAQFDAMTFQSLFGLSKLLESYGVESEAYALTDKAADLPRLTAPFLAHVPDGFVIVEATGPDCVAVNEGYGARTVPTGDFCKRWTGEVLLAFPKPDAEEPHYAEHRFVDLADKAKKWALAGALVFVFVYGFVTAGLWRHASTVLLTAITLAALYVTYELLLKTYGIASRRGDSICGIIDRSGCHTVLGTTAAKFFGLFGWSEVGFAYFSVTLGVLLFAPGDIGSLALINACCCPFSIWSVWYQKYRAKAWCTLCLITQACLWLSLACYGFGGWFRMSFPLSPSILSIGAAYVAVLLGLNALSPFFERHENS